METIIAPAKSSSRVCPNCGNAIENNRKKFCSERCRYWHNLIRKENESHLAPFRKRNEGWFYMVVGSEWAKSPRQGRRVGHMVTGGMGARVNVTVEKLVEVNRENIIKHFQGITGYQPDYIRLGNQERIYKRDILKTFGIDLS